MASMDYVVHQLEEMGLTVAVEEGFILAEDPDLDFTRSHDGVLGISRWLKETREEYEMTIADLLNENKDEEQAVEFAETQAAIEEEVATWTKDEQQFQASLEDKEEFAPAPPEKGHVIGSAQLALAKGLNEKRASLMSPKELWQATQGNDQDRGSVPNPADYIKDMKLAAIVVHSEKVEFEVSGIGYVTGEFKRRFTEKGTAQIFARACVAAAKSPKYASTVHIMTV